MNSITNMIEEAFADAAFVRRVPVDTVLEIFQELRLKVQELLEIDEDRLDLLFGKHVRTPAAFRDVTLGHVAQDLDEVALGLDELADHAGPHLLVREQGDACSSSKLNTRGSSRGYRGQTILHRIFLAHA